MPHKNKEERKKYYDKNKEEINKKRREYSKRPEVRERINKNDKAWRHNHRDKIKALNRKYHKKYRDKNRELVFNHYGKKCACCGESNQKFLSIDHINGEGTIHRKKIHRHINIWLVKNNFPKGFQTLCFNCNWGKYNNNGICPHKDNAE